LNFLKKTHYKNINGSKSNHQEILTLTNTLPAVKNQKPPKEGAK
jgi:hypothetical protein